MDASLAPFKDLLDTAVTPIVLISGVGLILLSSLNRYSQAASRTRQLISERRSSQGARYDNLTQQIHQLYKRVKILRVGISCLVISAICSSLIIFICVLYTVVGAMIPTELLITLLLLSCLCIVLANLLLLIEVTLSHRALSIELAYDAPTAAETGP